MKNPLEAVKAIASTISLAGKAVGTAERVFKAATADVDNDGKPELKNAAEGLVKAFGKLKDMGKVAKEAYEIVKVEVLPHLKNLFNAARDAAATKAQ